MKEKKKIVLSPRKVLILFSLGFAQSAIFLMPYISYVFYKPLQESLKCTNTQIGFLITLLGIAELVSFFPGGWLADKFNPKKLIIVGLTLVGVIVCICAFNQNYIFYCVMWGLMGLIANLIYWSAGMKSVRVNTEPDEQGKAYGYFYFFNSATGVIVNAGGAAIISLWVAYVALGFRYVVLLYGVLNFLAAIAIWRLLPSTPKTIENIKDNESDTEKITFKDFKYILKRKETWLFSIIAFCLYTMLALPTYFTPYFSDVMHLSIASAAIIYVITGPFSALLGPIMGTISDLIGSTIKTIIGVMIISLILVSVMLIFTGKLPLAVAIVIDTALTSMCVGIYSIMFSSIEEMGMDRRIAGSCIGVASIIAFTPDIFMYTLFGSWLDKYKNVGYKMIFTYGAVASLIAIVAAIALYSIIRKRKTAEISKKEAVTL